MDKYGLSAAVWRCSGAHRAPAAPLGPNEHAEWTAGAKKTACLQILINITNRFVAKGHSETDFGTRRNGPPGTRSALYCVLGTHRVHIGPGTTVLPCHGPSSLHLIPRVFYSQRLTAE